MDPCGVEGVSGCGIMVILFKVSFRLHDDLQLGLVFVLPFLLALPGRYFVALAYSRRSLKNLLCPSGAS
jgi:hypothetical protein